jgi:NDP-sugar pyrophosphorylase family protein
LTGDEPVLIYNVDVLSNLKFENVLNTRNICAQVLWLRWLSNRQTQRYFKFDNEKRLVGWINKKTVKKRLQLPENFEQSTEMAFSGIHVVSPEIFKLMPAEDRFSITDFYLELAKIIS